METSSKKMLLGLGTGQSGLRSLAGLLHRQADTSASHMEWPLLSWPVEQTSHINGCFDQVQPLKLAITRLKRLERTRSTNIVADSASFYLPFAEAILSRFETATLICLRRDREQTITSFCKWLDENQPLPTDHWSTSLPAGYYRDPVWSRIYPKISASDRSAAIGSYYDSYYAIAQQLATRYPQRFKIFDMHAALNTYVGQSELLEFCGYSNPNLIVPAKEVESRAAAPLPKRANSKPQHDPSRCVVLVPYLGHILPECDRSLRELERRNYTVRRVGGYAAIDQARNQMATDALIDGFEETMWIDSDIAFDPASVGTIRNHGLPVVSGLYAKKDNSPLPATCCRINTVLLWANPVG